MYEVHDIEFLENFVNIQFFTILAFAHKGGPVAPSPFQKQGPGFLRVVNIQICRKS